MLAGMQKELDFYSNV
jgi:ABC-type sugar transport system substrate-binding protein